MSIYHPNLHTITLFSHIEHTISARSHVIALGDIFSNITLNTGAAIFVK